MSRFMKTKRLFNIGILTISLLFVLSFNSFGQNDYKVVEKIYKQVDTLDIKMDIYYPGNFNKSEKYPTIVFFFGGGWVTRSWNQFKPFALHCIDKGMVAVIVDYRVTKINDSTPFESLKDAKSAFRYLRENASELNIDPNLIVGSGGSAGGHLAAASYTNETINAESDDLSVSAKPNALILFNPVVDNSKDGYGYERIGERYHEFSPLFNIHKGFPQTIFFLGTKDHLIPVSTGEKFKQKVDSVGSHCDLFLYENEDHGFFNKKIYHDDIFSKMDAFLRSNGYLKKVE